MTRYKVVFIGKNGENVKTMHVSHDDYDSAGAIKKAEEILAEKGEKINYARATVRVKNKVNSFI